MPFDAIVVGAGIVGAACARELALAGLRVAVCEESGVIGGGATALIALTFAELSVLLPVAGGTAQIPQLSHGSFTSFILSWVAWLSALTMAPIEVQAVLQYASTYFPSLTHLVNGAPVLTALGMCWATLLMLALCFINIGTIQSNSGYLDFGRYCRTDSVYRNRS